MQSILHYNQGSNPQYYLHFQGIKRTFCHTFHWRTKISKILNKAAKYQTTGWRKLEALLIDEVDDKVLVTTFTNGLQSKEFLFSIYKNDPEDDGWHVVLSHKVDECWRQHDSTKGQIEEKGKAWWPLFERKKKFSPNEWQKGWQKVKTSSW